jgi:hypothetical protein
MDTHESSIPSSNGHYFFLTEIAEQLRMHRAHARTYALRNGFIFSRQRDPSRGNHLSLVLSAGDLQRLLEIRSAAGFPVGGAETGALITCIEVGVFYLIQLVPDLSQLRIKMGFTDSLSRRLNEYLTSNPTAAVFQSWPCKRAWEQTAIASITRTGCRLIGGEVYDCDDLAALRERSESFFQLMPAV